jgi:hypothetical protein
MPLSGGWSGCGSNHVKVEPVAFVHFPGDKEIRNSVHARLAKKMAAREAQKAKQSAGVSAAPGAGEQTN